MDSENFTFTVVGDDGNEVECEILFTFENNATEKSYVVYTDHTLDEQGNYRVYANVYDPNDSILYAIETEEEWAVIEAMMDDWQAKYADEQE